MFISAVVVAQTGKRVRAGLQERVCFVVEMEVEVELGGVSVYGWALSKIDVVRTVNVVKSKFKSCQKNALTGVSSIAVDLLGVRGWGRARPVALA